MILIFVCTYIPPEGSTRYTCMNEMLTEKLSQIQAENSDSKCIVMGDLNARIGNSKTLYGMMLHILQQTWNGIR